LEAAVACAAQSGYIFFMATRFGLESTLSPTTGSRSFGGLHLLAVLGPLLRPAR
jgi:hypothetical protein